MIEVSFSLWLISIPSKDSISNCLNKKVLPIFQGQQGEELARVMYELLSTYRTEADAVKAQADAIECVRAALCDPGTLLFDHLLSLKPVQSLENDTAGDGKRLHALLRIFVDGRLADFEAW